jgi:hypothetical protein
MFLSTYEKLRINILDNHSIESLVHIGWNCFPEGHLYNRGVATVFLNYSTGRRGQYLGLDDLPAIVDRRKAFLERKKSRQNVFIKSADDFRSISGNPILYQLSSAALESLRGAETAKQLGGFKRGSSTSDNSLYLRFWYETEQLKFEKKWFPYNKGGAMRRWYGNQEYLVDWENDGLSLKSFDRAYLRNIQHCFKPAVSYSSLTSGAPSFRFYDGHLHDQAGNFLPHNSVLDTRKSLAALNSSVGIFFVKTFSPTINILIDDLGKVPLTGPDRVISLADQNVALARSDWDAYETSCSGSITGPKRTTRIFIDEMPTDAAETN